MKNANSLVHRLQFVNLKIYLKTNPRKYKKKYPVSALSDGLTHHLSVLFQLSHNLHAFCLINSQSMIQIQFNQFNQPTINNDLRRST